MEYTEFVKVMLREVKEQMEPEVTVEIHKTIKNNGAIRIGLIIGTKNINIAPTIYLEEFYEQYLNGVRIQELAHTIRMIYGKIGLKKSYPFEKVFSFNNIKDKIVCKLIHKESNRELLKEVPYEEYLDLAVVYYILLDYTEIGSATLLVHN